MMTILGNISRWVAPAQNANVWPPAGSDFLESESAQQAEIAKLYAAYNELIYRWARRILRDSFASEDVVSEVAIALLRHAAFLRNLATEEKRRSWLYTTTYRQCLATIRKSARERQRDTAVFHTAARESAFGCENRNLLESLMDRLDREERIIAVLHFEEGCSKMFIHKATGRGRPYIDQKLQRIESIMRELEKGLEP